MRLETSGDNPFTTSALVVGGIDSVLSDSVPLLPHIHGVGGMGRLHALETEGWNHPHFRVHACNGTALVNAWRKYRHLAMERRGDDSNSNAILRLWITPYSSGSERK